MCRIVKAVAVCVLIAASVVSAAVAKEPDPPKIAVSIAPLHSLVTAVAGSSARVELLIPGGQSPHTFQLRTSTVRTLADADLIVIVSQRFETAIAKPVRAQGLGEKTFEIAVAPGVSLLPARSRHDHGDETGPGHDDHADEAAVAVEGPADMHLWLDPRNAIAIVNAVAARLAALDPGHADTYAANAAGYLGRLTALDDALAADLAGVRDVRFVVFHDAYQYFEQRYGLMRPDIVTVSPERAPSVKRIREIRAAIESGGAVCIFVEPQFAPPVLKTIVEGLDVRTGTLDPLGAGLDEGPDLYPELLTRLGANLKACLSPS